MMMSFLEDLEKSFISFCSFVADSIKKTEKDLGIVLSEDEKKLVIGLSLLGLYQRYSKKDK